MLYWPGFALLGGVVFPTGKAVGDGTNPASTDATGTGTFNASLGVDIEKVHGPLYGALNLWATYSGSSTVTPPSPANAPPLAPLTTSYPLQLTALAVAGYFFESEAAVALYVNFLERGDTTINGTTAGRKRPAADDRRRDRAGPRRRRLAAVGFALRRRPRVVVRAQRAGRRRGNGLAGPRLAVTPAGRSPSAQARALTRAPGRLCSRAVIDIRLLRETPDEVRQAYARLGAPIDLDGVIAADARVRDLKNESQTLQAAQNKISKEIGRVPAGPEREQGPGRQLRAQARHRGEGRRAHRRGGEARGALAGAPQPAAPVGPRRQGRQREQGRARGGPEEDLRLRPQAALGPRHGARHHRLRAGREDLRLALLRAQGVGRAAAARAHHLHARSAHAEARLRRDLPALHGPPRVPGRHRQPPEVRREPLSRRRGGLLVHPDRRGPGHQPLSRGDRRRRAPADPPRRLHRLLPARADGGRPRHPRHQARPPVRQGGAGEVRPPGDLHG